MSDPTLLGICGTLRAASTNRLLMHEAARRFGPARFVVGDLRLPLYDGDIETGQGIPEAVQVLADQIAQADAVIVVTPEYNKGISGVLKNALDWVSRTRGSPWRDKPVALMSAAAGRAGGERAGDLIAEAVAAMEFGATSEDIARCCHAHPTLSELMHEAAMAVSKRAIHTA